MTLFPYVLLRVAGLPYSLMEQLRWDKPAINTYLDTAKLLENERQSLLRDLESLIGGIEDYPAKYHLKILRSDLFSERRIKVKSFIYHGKFTKEFGNVKAAVADFSDKASRLQSQVEELQIDYQQELLRNHQFVQAQSDHPILRKGLQLASHSVLQRIDRFRDQPPGRFNKKHRQTELTLLQYLSRICTKTSPFSQFTQLSFWDMDGKQASPESSKVRLNNQFYQLLRDALTFYPPFNRILKIRWNSSAQLVEGKWVYLLNTRNVESIQRMDHMPVLDLIMDILKSDQRSSFSKVCDQLSEHVEATKEELFAYLTNLINYGLLEWDWPISGLDPEWLAKLIDWLGRFDDTFLKDTHQVLKELQHQLQVFSVGSEAERTSALNQAYQLVQDFKDRLFATIDFPEQDLQKVRNLQTITFQNFTVPREQLFYEDVSRKVKTNWAKEDMLKIAGELHDLLSGIQMQYYKAEGYRHELFFAERFQGQTVPVLQYYDAFYQASPSIPDAPTYKIDQRRKLLKQTLDKGQWRSDDHFHIPADDWKKSASSASNTWHPSVGGLLQLYTEEGAPKAYVDAVTMGYGKYWGRFLHLFPETVTQAIRRRNESLQATNVNWIENVDASVYNPNIHPPLLKFEIQVPGGQQLRKPGQWLCISDFALRQRPASKEIELLHVPSASVYKVFDFGFEALENRSPLYQMLSLFSCKLTTPEMLINLLDQQISSTDDEGIQYWPRISFGQYLILRRRGWGIPPGALPIKARGENDFTYFMRLQAWRKQLGLPKRVFVKLVAPSSAAGERPRGGDHYKPQYIDFESPLFVQLFSKILPKVQTKMKIEEMLPEVKGEQFVKEMLIEMDGRMGSRS